LVSLGLSLSAFPKLSIADSLSPFNI
jgi:hypothetical protein